MTVTKTLLAALLIGATLGASAQAQDHSAHGGSGLPDACKAAGDHAAITPATGDMGSQLPLLDEGHQALIATMDPMHTNMMQGMMAPDQDVAFVCGMIPHHQGAIDMARVQLQYGKDQWAKDMAQKVIDAQEKEIAEMTKWLEEQAQ